MQAPHATDSCVSGQKKLFQVRESTATVTPKHQERREDSCPGLLSDNA